MKSFVPLTHASKRTTHWLLASALAVSSGSACAGEFFRVFRDGFEPLPVVSAEDAQLGEASGTVSLLARIVTARSSDDRHLWLADAAAAAPFQGIYVYRGSGATPLGVALGSLVDVVGTVQEFDGTPPGDTITEIEASSVLFVLPPQDALLPLQVGGVAEVASIVDGEPYEGVLVQVGDVRVTSTGPGTRMVVTDNAGATLEIANGAGGLGALPAVGSCFASIAGVMHLNHQVDQRVLYPRIASDLVSGNACN